MPDEPCALPLSGPLIQLPRSERGIRSSTAVTWSLSGTVRPRSPLANASEFDGHAISPWPTTEVSTERATTHPDPAPAGHPLGVCVPLRVVMVTRCPSARPCTRSRTKNEKWGCLFCFFVMSKTHASEIGIGRGERRARGLVPGGRISRNRGNRAGLQGLKTPEIWWPGLLAG
jgi:hypothetical protein